MRPVPRPWRAAHGTEGRPRQAETAPRCWRSPITPFIIAYYLLSLVAYVVAWMKGGHPERLGAMALLAVFGISVFVPETRMWNVFLDDAAIDVGLALFFGWQAMNRDRWWPLVMTALMILTLLVHVAVFAAPSVGAYADVSARVGLGIAMAVTLLAGTAERWLAGERAVSGRSVWTRRSSPAYPRGSGGASSEGAAPFRPSS